PRVVGHAAFDERRGRLEHRRTRLDPEARLARLEGLIEQRLRRLTALRQRVDAASEQERELPVALRFAGLEPDRLARGALCAGVGRVALAAVTALVIAELPLDLGEPNQRAHVLRIGLERSVARCFAGAVGLVQIAGARVDHADALRGLMAVERV